MRRIMAFISPLACSRVTPGFRRARTLWLYMLSHACSSDGVKAIGTQNSAGWLLLIGPRCGKLNDAGMTPTTV